jgi:pyridoxamine 5'-phosphate oxidase family protein
MFSAHELSYLQSQPLMRIGTVAGNGQVDVDAVTFEFDGACFFIGGVNLASTRKYKNIAGGQTLVSLLLDDLATVQPWQPRGLKVHGRAVIVQRDAGHFGPGAYFAVTPLVSWNWGVEGPVFDGGKFRTHKIVWPVAEAGDGSA